MPTASTTPDQQQQRRQSPEQRQSSAATPGDDIGMTTAAAAASSSGGAPASSVAGYAGDEMRVLLLVPRRLDAHQAAEALTGAGFVVSPVGGIEEMARHLLSERVGVAVVEQEALTPANLDLLDGVLARQPAWSDLPLIILTTSGGGGGKGGAAFGSQEAFLQDSERLPNATFLERPLRIATLVRAVRVGLRSRRRQYEIRGYLKELQRVAADRATLMDQQRKFLRDVLRSVTEGRLRLCETAADLPAEPAQTPAERSAPETFSLNAESLKRLRKELRAAAALVSLPLERTEDLITAAHEAAMNAVVHAGGGAARVLVDPARRVVQVWVTDSGAGIDMDWLPRATLERGSSSAGTLGHGFWLMLQTADAVYLLTGPQGTTVVIEQGVTPPPAAWRH